MPDDYTPSQKYLDTGIPRYFVTSSIVDNFCMQNSNRIRIVRSALADSLSYNCVLMILYVNFLPLDVVVMLLAFMLLFLMYADDLLLISSTCSDLRRMLRTVFSKPTVYNIVTFNTAVFF